jgi:predicted transcriptional regulator
VRRVCRAPVARRMFAVFTYSKPLFGGLKSSARKSRKMGAQGKPTNRGGRHYRSRVEILRDFLISVRESGKKTHIIGRANLNPNSFRTYLQFSLALKLVEQSDSQYLLTRRADGVIEVIDRLLARTAEVNTALLDLKRGLDSMGLASGSPNDALRFVSNVVWNEAVRSAVENISGAVVFPRNAVYVGTGYSKSGGWTGQGATPGSFRTSEVNSLPQVPTYIGTRRRPRPPS